MDKRHADALSTAIWHFDDQGHKDHADRLREIADAMGRCQNCGHLKTSPMEQRHDAAGKACELCRAGAPAAPSTPPEGDAVALLTSEREARTNLQHSVNTMIRCARGEPWTYPINGEALIVCRAFDALRGEVEGLRGRLGECEASMRDLEAQRDEAQGRADEWSKRALKADATLQGERAAHAERVAQVLEARERALNCGRWAVKERCGQCVACHAYEAGKDVGR